MAVTKIVAVALLLVAFASRSPGSAQSFCQFTLPAYGQPDQHCTTFDLSGIAHMAAFNISSDGTVGWQGGDTYLFSICDTVSFNAIPIVCYQQKPSPAYKFNTASRCDSLGKLEDFFVVR